MIVTSCYPESFDEVVWLVLAPQGRRKESFMKIVGMILIIVFFIILAAWFMSSS